MNNQENEICLEIAKLVIKIVFHENDNNYVKKSFINQVKNFYRGFILQDNGNKNNFFIDVYNQSILFLEKSAGRVKRQFVLISKEYFKSKKVKIFYNISLSQFSLLITRILQKLLPLHIGLMLHASSVIYKEKAFLFLGVSGAGKSTVTQLLKNKAEIFTDDTVILKKEKNHYYCYQAPIIEKNQCKKNKEGYPIKNFYFLKQSKKYKIEKINNKEKIINLLLKQLFTERKYLPKQMPIILNMVKNLDSFYFLHFKKNKKELIRLFYEN
jgi:hypothetical protein